ncbi:MAG TPA: TorF family putative porin [Gammaproteobacteria bacterium]|nr:TorF family putative porin [Gammaproteobacteria bacterium]
MQGSFDYRHPSGFYAHVWGSNWDGFGTESANSKWIGT